MGSFASCDGSVLSNEFKSCFYGLDSEEFCVKHEQCSPYNTKKNVNELFFEDFDSSTSEEEDFNDSMVKELGMLLCDTLHIHEHPGALGVGNPALYQDDICKQMEIKPVSFDTDVPLGLSNCAPIQCSELVQSYPINSDTDGLLRMIVINENNSKAQSLAFVQQLQTTSVIIPALKGSRALYGKHLNTKLSVKWAPDVYDPPATSSSHTVKGPRRHRHHHHHHHHHDAKSKKDHHNSKYSKGKSSRSISMVTERKHATNRRSSLTDPRSLRMQSLGFSRPVLNSCGRSKIEPHDLASGSNDDAIKHGRSCSTESPALACSDATSSV